MSLKDKNFALFMTRGMSLFKWDKIGTLEREIKPYQNMASIFNRVYIFTYGDVFDNSYSRLFPENVHIVVKPKFLPSTIYSILLPFIHFNKLRNIHILKTNQMDGSWPAVISKKLFKNKLIVRCGYEWLQTIKKAKKSALKRFFAYCVEKFTYNNADKIILTSEESKQFVISMFDVNPEVIQIIPNYIDINLFKNLNIPKEKNRIIVIGRLEKDKNLINLFNSIKGEDVSLVVVGEGSLRGELEKIATENNLNVEFKGSVAQALIPEELNKSELFVLPSLYEGNPKVLLEAMSCGLPCIGSNVDGINSVIKDMENGILSAIDSASIREAIKRLLGDKELCVKLGTNARRGIEVNNSFRVCVEKELLLYQSVLE